MDIRRILNINDSSKPSNKSGHSSSRSGHSRTASRSSTSKTSTRPTTSVKIEPTWPLSPIHSPTNSVSSNTVSWSSLSPTESVSSYGRISTTIRPRITTSITSPSTAAKRRASAHSPVSRSPSSSSSSPAPPTPSSIISTGHGFGTASSSINRQHKRAPSSTDSLPAFHQISTQPAYTISLPPSTMTPIYTSQQAQSAIHTHRILPPLPINRSTPQSAAHHHPHQQQQQQQQQSQHPSNHRPLAPQHPTTLSLPLHNSTTTTTSGSNSRLCSASPSCDYTTPKRRIVSQFFGRNKKETRLIPRHCWVYYCRQHYQRSRYRLCAGRFAELQMGLVRATVAALEKEGIVVSWEVKLRKRALERIARDSTSSSSSGQNSISNSNSSSSRPSGSSTASKRASKSFSSGSGSSSSPSSSSGGGAIARERVLLPYCGAGKSFKHVYEVLDLVRDVCQRDGGAALEFEVLPVFTTEWVRGEEERRRIARAEGGGCGGSDSESDDDDGR